MNHEFIAISIYKRNQYSRGDLSALDKEEILNLLNSRSFLARHFLKVSSPESSLLGQACQELEEEYRLLYPNSSDDALFYSQNCHSLARKMNEHLGWNIICGYVFKIKDFNESKSSLRLTSHSISQDDSGNLIELTVSFDPGETIFIHHRTGGFGIDLEAHHGYS
jgi:hypothetical protein